jgi:polyhydroxyalkanoate synthase
VTRIAPDEDLRRLAGLGDTYAERLRAAGVETMEELAAADRAGLAEETGLPIGRIRTFVGRASIQDVTDQPETE